MSNLKLTLKESVEIFVINDMPNLLETIKTTSGVTAEIFINMLYEKLDQNELIPVMEALNEEIGLIESIRKIGFEETLNSDLPIMVEFILSGLCSRITIGIEQTMSYVKAEAMKQFLNNTLGEGLGNDVNIEGMSMGGGLGSLLGAILGVDKKDCPCPKCTARRNAESNSKNEEKTFYTGPMGKA